MRSKMYYASICNQVRDIIDICADCLVYNWSVILDFIDMFRLVLTMLMFYSSDLTNKEKVIKLLTDWHSYTIEDLTLYLISSLFCFIISLIALKLIFDVSDFSIGLLHSFRALSHFFSFYFLIKFNLIVCLFITLIKINYYFNFAEYLLFVATLLFFWYAIIKLREEYVYINEKVQRPGYERMFLFFFNFFWKIMNYCFILMVVLTLAAVLTVENNWWLVLFWIWPLLGTYFMCVISVLIIKHAFVTYLNFMRTDTRVLVPLFYIIFLLLVIFGVNCCNYFFFKGIRWALFTLLNWLDSDLFYNELTASFCILLRFVSAIFDFFCTGSNKYPIFDLHFINIIIEHLILPLTIVVCSTLFLVFILIINIHLYGIVLRRFIREGMILIIFFSLILIFLLLFIFYNIIFINISYWIIILLFF